MLMLVCVRKKASSTATRCVMLMLEEEGVHRGAATFFASMPTAE